MKHIQKIICKKHIIFFTICFSIQLAAGQNKNTFTDTIDGRVYAYVIIGEQTWMAQNLNYVTETSWCYKDSIKYCEKVGRLYIWEEALEVCPDGWHLPSQQEWDTLISFLGGKWRAGGKLKEKGTKHWEWPNKGAVDTYGFKALPTDIKLKTGGYIGLLKSNAEFWSSTEIDEVSARSFKLYSSITLADLAKAYKTTALSIRCIRNE